MIALDLPASGSRRDTTAEKAAYVGQLGLDARPGSRAWVHRALRVRVAESRAERHLAALIVRRRHYLQSWPVPPETRFLSYLGDLSGVEDAGAGTAAMAMVALLPNQYPSRTALGLGQLEALTLVRLYRADDLMPAIAPDLTPEALRRIVRGERGWTHDGDLVRPLAVEWAARKLDRRLRCVPRLLVTHADPGVGHDGATYLAAGAVCTGVGESGKREFTWDLTGKLREPLAALAQAVQAREAA